MSVQQIEDTRFEFEPAPSPPPRTTPTSSPEPAMDAVTTDPRKPQPPQPEAPSAAVEQVPEAPVEAAAALSINPSASSAAAPEDIELLPPAESDPAAVTEEPAADPSASMEVDPTEAEVKSEPVDVVVDEIPAAAVSTPSETLAMDAAIAATLATLGTVVDSKPAAEALTAVAESGPGARVEDATNATSTPLYPYSEASTPNGTPGPSAAPAPRPSRFSDATPSSIVDQDALEPGRVAAQAFAARTKAPAPVSRVAQLTARVESDPLDGEARLALLADAEQKGDLERTREVYEDFLKVFPDAVS